MALPSPRVSSVASLFVLLALAAAAITTEADPAQDTRQDEMTTLRFPVLPSPDPQQRDARVIYRHKEMHPCQCENGGKCNRRVRVCQCTLGYSGARCEIVDHEFFAEQEALEAAEKEREQQLLLQQAVDSAASGCYPFSALWLVYVGAVVATVLLLLMLRAFALLAASIYQGAKGEKKKPHALPALYDDDVENIYTLPLRPPPYSEKPPAICSSTPLSRPPCCAQRLLELQLQPDYLRTLQPLQHKEQPDACIF